MSVCNLIVDADRILCITDTLVYQRNQPVGLCASKVSVADNGRWGWTLRGLSLLADVLAPAVNLCADVDEAVALAGDLLDRTRPPAAAEVTVFGLSSLEGRVVALRVVYEPGRAAELVELGGGVHLMPPPPPGVQLPESGDVELLRRLSLAQWRAKQYYANWGCIGGSMDLTTVTRDGVTVERIGNYPDHDELVRQFGEEPAHA